MYEALVKFGFSNSFIRWVKTLYTDIQGCMLNNGWVSAPYKILRGIRQGCPLSSLIFVIAVEILACQIRQNKDIKGFQIKIDTMNHSIKISQMADDTTLFLANKRDVSLALNVIEIFGSLSGLKLNRSKTEGIWLGRLKHCKEKIENVNWTKSIVKSLGIYFGINKKECDKLNIESVIEKSENIVLSWKKRNLTMIGRIAVVKSLILPNLTYLANTSSINKEYINKFKKLIYNFIWDSKREKIKRITLSQDYTEGGLKITDIDNYIAAIKLSWVKRLTTGEFANWKVIPAFYFNNFGKDFLIFNMPVDNILSIPKIKVLPEFYMDIVKTWFEKVKIDKNLQTISSFRVIRQQLLWGNKYIKFQNKCLVFTQWIKDNIYCMNDIINDQGYITQDYILSKLSNKSNWISEFTRLKNSIPKEWINILKSEDSIKTNVKTDLNLNVKIGTKKVNIMQLETRDLYKFVNSLEKNTPPGFSKWTKQLNLDNTFLIREMLVFIFYKLKDNKLKIFRWKLLHYILPCKVLLHQWKIATNNTCDFCNQVDDYEHFFVNCPYLSEFWGKFKILLVKLKFGIHTVNFRNLIIGYKIWESNYYDINFIFTLVLFSINKSFYKSDNKQKSIDIYAIFKQEFLKRVEINNTINGKRSDIIESVYSYLQEI